ncbi:MAG: hypothetical protein AAF467_20635 [Actinomycetota bacterium]
MTSERGMGSEREIMAALRKSAILAHWVPGVSLLIQQAHEPLIAVSCDSRLADTYGCSLVHPCEYRRQVVDLVSSSAAGLPPAFNPGDLMHIEIMADVGTTVDADGVVSAQFDEHHTMVGFAVLAEAPGPDQHAGGCQWSLNEAPVLESHDPDLKASLLTCSFPTGDPARTARARQAILDRLVVSEAEEIAALASLAGPQW